MEKILNWLRSKIFLILLENEMFKMEISEKEKDAYEKMDKLNFFKKC